MYVQMCLVHGVTGVNAQFLVETGDNFVTELVCQKSVLKIYMKQRGAMKCHANVSSLIGIN